MLVYRQFIQIMKDNTYVYLNTTDLKPVILKSEIKYDPAKIQTIKSHIMIKGNSRILVYDEYCPEYIEIKKDPNTIKYKEEAKKRAFVFAENWIKNHPDERLTR